MKKVFLIIISTTLIAIGSYFFVQYFNKDSNRLYSIGYNEKTINYLLRIEKTSQINSYSKTIEKLAQNNDLDARFINDYLVIDYIENEKYGEIINKLLINKYSPSQINKIIKYTNLENIDFILNNPKNEKVLKFIESKYCKNEYMDRYIAYQEKKIDYPIEKIIIEVNIGIDQSFYTNTKKTDITKKYLMLVNKYNYIDSNFKSSNLVQMESGYSINSQYLDEEVYNYLKELIDNAKKDKIKIFNISAYRSYSKQESLYNGYVKRDGKEKADTYSARPGSSEHQTGFATDLNTGSSKDMFEKTKEYAWLSNNAYKYGFILRYPLGKEYITGYKFEPWHWRYVGIKASTTIHNEKITFEEYYVKYVDV